MKSDPESRKAALEGAMMAVELIFYGQLGLVQEADRVLGEYGYGRAHFRTMYVVARQPGITTAQILIKLKIKNQSLARVMGSLVRDRMIVQEADIEDRRQRRHALSEAGGRLFEQCLTAQLNALMRAFEEAGSENAQGFLRTLYNLVSPEDRYLLTARPSND